MDKTKDPDEKTVHLKAVENTGPAKAPILVHGKKYENIPEELFISHDALEVFLETFQGPLDLLMHLIRKQNIEILDIPVALITQQYMEYVDLMRTMRLDLASEYLVMAAMLAEIKSRMLLPRSTEDEQEEEEDPRLELVRRLQEYERFSQAAQDIDSLPRVERDLYLVPCAFEDEMPPVLGQASLNDLTVAFRNVVERTEFNRQLVVDREELSVRERMGLILERIDSTRSMRFEALFDPSEGRQGAVVCFLALLELVREQAVNVIQNEAFSPIYLRSKEREAN
ncbi:MAG: segregation/condensation protein A [Gammaproteobacteria bacterium]|nr:segregation/condensation protein A [Gammaproteobacteria bacterium]MCY4227807.1 segregation/condensation protein A [Gammaproteobacteria bacterium]MCY4312882.1 segregation/condensation protein A [Gammaproteobacteria bacterium]